MTSEEVEQIRAERALEIAPVEISRHTARRIVAHISTESKHVSKRRLAEHGELIAILKRCMQATEQQHKP